LGDEGIDTVGFNIRRKLFFPLFLICYVSQNYYKWRKNDAYFENNFLEPKTLNLNKTNYYMAHPFTQRFSYYFRFLFDALKIYITLYLYIHSVVYIFLSRYVLYIDFYYLSSCQ